MKTIVLFSAFYIVLMIVCYSLQYLGVLPPIVNKLSIAILMASVVLVSNVFVKNYKRVPATNEKLVFAFSLVSFDFIKLALWMLLYYIIASKLSMPISTLFLIAIMIKFLTIYFSFGVFSKIFLKNLNKNSLL
ncbi:MAG: ABZJ_00895 family protein [Campylobacteraceae bacterium]|jgi:hypothetical protein|nr:ABZJ_00895 family protein [Campylobacteraceae bacterium]